MASRGFKGGIHPPENKKFSENKAFENLSVPHTCFIPLQQHIGKAAVPVVSPGDMVTEGQLIGSADGMISAPVHASIPGNVLEIAGYPTVYAPSTPCVVIEAEGSFSTFKEDDTGVWKNLGREEILSRIRDAGVVGMGGAAFPTSVKLSPPDNKKIDTFIVNGAECEPYLTVDDMLMQTHSREIIEGIQIILKVLGIEKAFIGIEKNKPAAIASLKEALTQINPSEKIEVCPLKTKYPQGAEKQLIRSITGREVPSGGLPMDAGAVVNNVGTVFALREAVVMNKPLIERYLTLTGSIVNKPGNYKARLGTRIADIVEEAGGLKEEPARIIMGGPMCGIALYSMDVPVVKGTSGLLFLSRSETRAHQYQACIRCGRCVGICPSGLIPCDLGNAMEKNRLDVLEELNPFDCIMCGSCTYVCPSRRPLSHFIKLAQQKLRLKK